MGESVNYQMVADRIGNIQETISLRAANPVTIVAVTKGFGADAVRAATKAGIYDIGENYAQEMIRKRDLLEREEERDVNLPKAVRRAAEEKAREEGAEVATGE